MRIHTQYATQHVHMHAHTHRMIYQDAQHACYTYTGSQHVKTNNMWYAHSMQHIHTHTLTAYCLCVCTHMHVHTLTTWYRYAFTPSMRRHTTCDTHTVCDTHTPAHIVLYIHTITAYYIYIHAHSQHARHTHTHTHTSWYMKYLFIYNMQTHSFKVWNRYKLFYTASSH